MKNEKIRRMTGIALLMALVVVMQYISSLIPPVGGFSISLVLIPIVIGAAMYGPSGGVLLGGVFGLVVYINCVTGADPGGQMVFQASPILCFLVVMAKGILAGLISGLIYKLVHKCNAYVAMVAAAIACPVVNTGVFVVCMLTFFREVLSAWAKGGDLLAYVFSGLLFANFLPELLINVVFSPFGQRIIHIVKK